MPILYSLSKKKSNISKDTTEGKLYAIAQHSGVVGTEAFIKTVCKRFRSLDEGQVMSVFYAVTQTLRSEMLDGRRVEVEPLGEFYPVINGRGCTNSANFARSNIKNVKVNWVPGGVFDDLIKYAKFRLTTTRKEQRDCKRESKRRLDEGYYVEPTEEG